MSANSAFLQIVRNEPSYCFGTRETRVAVTRLGGMMAPVTFFADSEAPVAPYYVAPWADQGAPEGMVPLLAALRGDFFCAPFGDNETPHAGILHPPHGEVCAGHWQCDALHESEAGAAIEMHFDNTLMPGTIRKTLAVRHGESVIYSRHVLQGMQGGMTLGHHPTLHVPDSAGQGYLSFSAFDQAWTYIEPTGKPEELGYSWLKPRMRIDDLRACPTIDGGTTDLTRYPARRGFEDIVLLHSRHELPFAWSAFSLPSLGYVWFSLKDPRTLDSTMLWMSNGGRHASPWNGRNFNTIGIEEIVGHFHEGIDASLRKNFLNEHGVRTCVELNASQALRINFIQGVVRVGPDFKGVSAIDAIDEQRIRLTDDQGRTVETNLALSFLQSGVLQDWMM